MRLAYLLGTWPSRSETFLCRELEGLRAAGLEVLTVAFRPGPDGPSAETAYRPAVTDCGLTRHPLPALAGLCRPLTPLRAWTRRVRNVPFAAWLTSWCLAHGIDRLHAAWSGLPAQVAWMARRLGGPPYSVSAHARDVFAPWECHPQALLSADGVSVCNRAAEAELLRCLPGLAGQLVYHPHGLPLVDWPMREAEPTGPPVLLGVGRLVPKKGFDTLLQAAREVPGSEVVVAGEGPERTALAGLAAELGVNLWLPGYVSLDEVATLLRRATVVVLPSRRAADGDRDGLANVLLEAMATGVPVVTTTAGSATDVVSDGGTGWLVPPDDPGSLATALRRVLGDGAGRARVVEAARAAVVERFDAEVNTARLANWLRNLTTNAPQDGADG